MSGYPARRAECVISTPASAFETGQFSAAAVAAAPAKPASSRPGTRPCDVEVAARDALARLEADGRRDAQLLGRIAALRETVRERHAETGRVGGGDQLLGARRLRALLGALRPRHAEVESAPLAAVTLPAPSVRLPFQTALHASRLPSVSFLGRGPDEIRPLQGHGDRAGGTSA